MTETVPARPWLRLYTPGVDPDLVPPEMGVLDSFLTSVEVAPDRAALHFFGRTMSRREVRGLAAQVAQVFSDAGVGAGDRVAISLQNTPVFAAALLAAWGLRAVVVPLNPMLRPDELTPMLDDCGARVILAHPEMLDVVIETRARLDAELLCLWSPATDLAGEMKLPFDPATEVPVGERLLLEACARLRPDFEWAIPDSGEVAIITYTSGTTGPSKGALSTHGNLGYQMLNFHQWFHCDEQSSILTIAPLFHITGMGAHVALGLGGAHPLVLTYRFEPSTVLALIDRYRPTTTIGAITAFISLLSAGPDAGKTLSILRDVFSGGAPVPSQVVDRFQSETGIYIHNIYGLTETTSACISVPLGAVAPVDEQSGALSIGVPMGGTRVTIVDDNGNLVPPGTQGEIVVSGPQVDAGYWRRESETENTFRSDGVHTGDVGVMDEDGWVYLVDRKKDLVVVSGYKVWPRDVEDVIYQHPRVQEVAVVGKPDPYRGETLHAFIVPRGHGELDVEDVRAWCRERLSAYKVPTHYTLVNELPKTLTGKILRRNLRD